MEEEEGGVTCLTEIEVEREKSRETARKMRSSFQHPIYTCARVMDIYAIHHHPGRINDKVAERERERG
jgi:ABC-type glutathione transport system ATPase component